MNRVCNPGPGNAPAPEEPMLSPISSPTGSIRICISPYAAVIVRKMAHRYPIVPNMTARAITGSSGFTSPISSPMIRIPLRRDFPLCMIFSSLMPFPPFRTVPVPSERSTALHTLHSSPSVPYVFHTPQQDRPSSCRSCPTVPHWRDDARSG